MIWNACLRYGSWIILFMCIKKILWCLKQSKLLKDFGSYHLYQNSLKMFSYVPVFQNYWCRTEIPKLLWTFWDSSAWRGQLLQVTEQTACPPSNRDFLHITHSCNKLGLIEQACDSEESQIYFPIIFCHRINNVLLQPAPKGILHKQSLAFFLLACTKLFWSVFPPPQRTIN